MVISQFCICRNFLIWSGCHSIEKEIFILELVSSNIVGKETESTWPFLLLFMLLTYRYHHFGHQKRTWIGMFDDVHEITGDERETYANDFCLFY